MDTKACFDMLKDPKFIGRTPFPDSYAVFVLFSF